MEGDRGGSARTRDALSEGELFVVRLARIAEFSRRVAFARGGPSAAEQSAVAMPISASATLA